IRAPAGSTARRTTTCLPWKKTGEATSASTVVARRVEDCAVRVVLRVLRVLNVLSTISTASTLITCTFSTLGPAFAAQRLRRGLAVARADPFTGGGGTFST